MQFSSCVHVEVMSLFNFEGRFNNFIGDKYINADSILLVSLNLPNIIDVKMITFLATTFNGSSQFGRTDRHFTCVILFGRFTLFAY